MYKLNFYHNLNSKKKSYVNKTRIINCIVNFSIKLTIKYILYIGKQDQKTGYKIIATIVEKFQSHVRLRIDKTF